MSGGAPNGAHAGGRIGKQLLAEVSSKCLQKEHIGSMNTSTTLWPEPIVTKPTSKSAVPSVPVSASSEEDAADVAVVDLTLDWHPAIVRVVRRAAVMTARQ